MKLALKTFFDAAAETPRLYFAPLIGLVKAARAVQHEMQKQVDEIQPASKRHKTRSHRIVLNVSAQPKRFKKKK